MKKLIFLLTMASIMIFIGIGCSDGDSSTAPIVEGNLNDSDFQFAQSMIEGGDMFDEVMSGLDIGTSLLEQEFPTSFGKRAVSLSTGTQEDDISIGAYSHSYSAGWHIFEFALEVYSGYSDTIAMTGIDSIMVTKAGVAMPVPDYTFDAAYFHGSYAVDASASNIEMMMSGVHVLDVTDIDFSDSMDVITINGSAATNVSGSFQSDSSACDLSMEQNVSLTNVDVYIDGDDCPISATLNASITIDMSCTQGLQTSEVNAVWSYTAVVADGNVTATYRSGNTEWIVTDSCYSSGPMAIRYIPKH